MRLRVFRVLVLVIACVVPFQGMAAVVAAQCMALGHHQDTASHAAHGDTAETQVEHDHATDLHPNQADDQASDENSSNGSHCGPCTACCASASISGPAALSFPSWASNPPYVFSQFAPPGVQLDGLDRPPTAL